MFVAISTFQVLQHFLFGHALTLTSTSPLSFMWCAIDIVLVLQDIDPPEEQEHYSGIDGGGHWMSMPTFSSFPLRTHNVHWDRSLDARRHVL